MTPLQRSFFDAECTSASTAYFCRVPQNTLVHESIEIMIAAQYSHKYQQKITYGVDGVARVGHG